MYPLLRDPLLAQILDQDLATKDKPTLRLLLTPSTQGILEALKQLKSIVKDDHQHIVDSALEPLLLCLHLPQEGIRSAALTILLSLAFDPKADLINQLTMNNSVWFVFEQALREKPDCDIIILLQKVT